MIAFVLSMPGVGSWNGKWSGADRPYVKVLALGRSATAIKQEAEIVAGSPYRYDFGDGWAAAVSVRAVDAREARRMRSTTAGFAGYDWMVKEILEHGRILALAERAET